MIKRIIIPIATLAYFYIRDLIAIELERCVWMRAPLPVLRPLPFITMHVIQPEATGERVCLRFVVSKLTIPRIVEKQMI